MKEGWLKVRIEKPSKEEIESYYENTGEYKKSTDGPRVFKKAEILKTFDNARYPVESIWMMGESEGLVINFFGEKKILIQEKDLYERID